jgi:hypothetical protein
MMYHVSTNDDRRDEAPEVPEGEICLMCDNYPCRCLTDEQDEMEYM